jgi:NitT/TauT family transport system substrate-binding protein
MGRRVAGHTRRKFVQGIGTLGLAALAVPASAAYRARSDDGLGSALLFQTSEGPLSPPVTVRCGVTNALAEAGQFIAVERGYFREQGLEVEFTPFDSAAGMIAPLASGQLDVGAGGVGAGLFNAVARGVPIRIVGPQARHDAGASAVYLTVRKELIDSGQFRDYADLRGRRLAVNARGVVTEYGAVLALARGGLQPSDVDWVELSFPDMVVGFANGAIDVAVQNEPAATLGASRGVSAKWREIADVQPGMQFTVVLYGPEFATQRSEAARRWMLAYLRGVHDYTDAFRRNRDRAEIVAILARHTPVRDVALYEQMGFAHVDPNGRVGEVSLAEQLQWYTQRGLVTQPIDLQQVIDLSFADYAVQRLGRYE